MGEMPNINCIHYCDYDGSCQMLKELKKSNAELARLKSLIRAALNEAQSCEGTVTGMVRILARWRGEGE